MPYKHYEVTEKFLLAVDSIILGFKDGALHLLISRRPIEPEIGGWSLMGGFVQPYESINQAAKRVVAEYTGIENIYMEQTGAYGEVERDSGARVVSIAYYALVNMEHFDTSLAQKFDAKWVNIRALPTMIFDHQLMINDTIKMLQRRAAVKPIGFNLLGEKFTLPTLQSLYEAIYNEPIDKRNFRKKLQNMDILEKLDEKDKASSRRGAFYYRFNKAKYDQLIDQGMHFSL